MSWFKRLLRTSVKRARRSFGYKLAAYPSEPPVDLQSLCNHPLAARYFSVSKLVLITVAVSSGRGLRTFPLDASTHPFVLALNSAALTDYRKSCIRATLRAHYELTQPCSADERRQPGHEILRSEEDICGAVAESIPALIDDLTGGIDRAARVPKPRRRARRYRRSRAPTSKLRSGPT